MFTGLLSELRIKLRDEQPVYLVKSSLPNTSILGNEAQIFHVQDPSTNRKLRRVDELSSVRCESTNSARLPTRYETGTVFPSVSESGEGGVEIYRIRR